MDWSQETALLRRAAEEGLIRGSDDSDLERLLEEQPPAAPEPCRWGTRIDRLIRQKRLDERVVQVLAAELEHQPTRQFFRSPPAAPVATLPTERAIPGQRPQSRAAPARSADPRQGWPVQGWDRFEFVAFLGEGGMGRVYKGYDRRLGRPVAVKFLRGDDPENAKRFLQEARAQARVDHEHVCKIYETGEVEGRLFIAMQFLGGETLERAAAKMDLEEKLRVLAQVAEGIHAAHRLGLIHRDIKPANILVERTADGAWHPYVLDFGLAREVEAPGLTQTGFLVGTPAYLAPEQARGERALDGRMDVHALGATLYCVLSGRPPFSGETSFEVLQQVVSREPPALRKLDPAIPAEVETIVMKCLEKDPARRYDSARALAADLERYLAGDPIQARAPTLTYLVAKRLRKNRVVAGVGAAAAAGVLIAAGLAVRTELRSREQARLASLFGQEVRFAEEMLRRAHTAKLHDVTPERDQIEERVRALERQMEEAGSAGEGPGHYALGRILLALDDAEAAREHLDKAWARGYRVPEVAYALGSALGALYRDELEEAEQVEPPETLPARRKELAAEYRDPALFYLRESAGVRVDSPEYVQALIAFHEDRDREALALAAAARRNIPWLYEAWLLEGEILAEAAGELRDAGNEKGASDAYRRADAALRKAVEIGKSDPHAYEELARLWLSILDAVQRSGGDPGRGLQRVEEASRKALAAEPGRAGVYRILAHARKNMAQHEIRREDRAAAAAALNGAIQAALEAVRLEPRNEDGYFRLGLVYLQRARFERRLGADPRRVLEAAMRSFQAVLAMRPQLGQAHQNLGNTWVERAGFEIDRGLDASGSCNRAALHLAQAAALRPSDALPHYNLGNLYLSLARDEARRGRDPAKPLARAVVAYNEALKRNPAWIDAEQHLGSAYRTLARYRVDHGQDPQEPALRAIACYRRVVRARSEATEAYINLANLFADIARYQGYVGQDARKPLRQAAEAYARAAEAGGASSAGRLGRVYADLAVAEAAAGGSPEPLLAQAREAAELARGRDPKNPEVWADAAAVALARARCAAGPEADPAPAFAQAEDELTRALDLAPSFPQAWLALADLHRRRAEWRAEHGLHIGDIGDVGEDLRRGLAAADRALEADPRWGEALAVRGVLELAAARAEPDPVGRAAAAGRAHGTLTRALAINRNLRREYEPYLRQAQALGTPVS